MKNLLDNIALVPPRKRWDDMLRMFCCYQRQVNQQCTNTNASIVVSSAAITSKRQPPEHILLPEHSNHVKFPAMASASLFGRGGQRQIEAAGQNEHA